MFRELIKDFKKAKRPVLLIGGGARGADIRELEARLNCPAIPTWNAIDIVTSDDPYYRGRIGTYGSRGGNFTIQNADLILAIGCRFSGRITGGNVKAFGRNAKIYAVDIDRQALMNPTVRIDKFFCTDAWIFVNLFLAEMPQQQGRIKWLDKTLEWNKKYPPVLYDGRYMRIGDACTPAYSLNSEEDLEIMEGVNPYVFIKTLSEECDKDDIIVSDCGGNVVVVYQAFETKEGQRLISSHGNSPMGFSFAGAIGACLATKKRVICLIGDGGFNMNIQELQTLKNYNLNLKTFIMNNHIYGITQQFQDTHFEGRYEACGPKGYNPPNFMGIVQAYRLGIDFIEGEHNLRNAIRFVLNYDKAIVCDVDMGNWHTYEPRILGFDPLEDMSPKLAREELRRNML